ncbi:hypothetical protein [Nocardia wallacei]|uniref:hypothetical protein n=1 Tax=Nocardia wallacei TaxID=480035 RepID=UPI0024567B70|nr:hypothetical protein [Nocardia wallacei]
MTGPHTTATLDFSAAARRGARGNPILSVIIDGGACDDIVHGAGFAHLREHWALASFRRMFGAALIMSTAKTLHFQTEFLLFMDSSAGAPFDTVDWWSWSAPDLDREVSVIDEEIVSAESNAAGAAVDRELPRRLQVYGAETDWGYGDRHLIRCWTVDSLSAAVRLTWGARPRMFVTASEDVVGWRQAAPGTAGEFDRGTIVVDGTPSSTRDSEPGSGVAAYCGWRFRYDNWHRLEYLEDLATLMRLVVHDGLVSGLGPAGLDVRPGQFGETYVTRGSEYLAIGIRQREPVAPSTYRMLSRGLLQRIRGLLLTEVRTESTRLLAAVDRHRLVRRARRHQTLAERVVAHNRAAVLGGDPPNLRATERNRSEYRYLARELLRVSEEMLSIDPEVVLVGAGQS